MSPEPPSRPFAGLDIGGSKVLAVAADAEGRVLASVRLATRPGAQGVVSSAAEALAALAGRLGVEQAALGSVGVGVPGLVDPVRGCLSHAVNLGVGADELDLAGLLGDRCGLPVRVENDVNAAALGAATCLRLLDVDLAYLSIGTGLAAGLVLHGRLRRGSRAAAGEIGHVPVDPAGPQCACGQLGCLEALASGAAIAAAWPVQAAAVPAAAVPAARALFRAAAGGDPAAVVVRDRIARHLAAAVRLLVLTVDVDVVVLGGGVAEVGEPLRLAVATALARQGERAPFLRALDLPARVGIVGAGQPVAAIGAALLGHEPSAGADRAAAVRSGPVGDRHGIDLPDLAAVVVDGAVGGEEPAPGGVQD
jgi:glucokinase